MANRFRKPKTPSLTLAREHTGKETRRRAMAACLALSAATSAALADDLSIISDRVKTDLLSSLPSTSSVQSYLGAQQSNGSWTDVNYASTAATNWSPLTHLQRMQAMAQLYASPGSAFYQSPAVAGALGRAMDYWVAAKSTSTNWFPNEISGPQALGSAMLLAKPVFNAGQIASGQAILQRSIEDIPNWTGQNTVDLSIVGVYSAIVGNSNGTMTNAFGHMNGTVFVSNFGTDGIQADNTYHIHDVQLYMGGYGTSYINDMLKWSSTTAGTQYALTDTQHRTIVNYLLDGTQWFIRGQTLDLAANGRQVTFPTYVGAGDGYGGVIGNALTLGNYRTAELQAFLARQQATVATGSANTQNALVGNRAFFNSDAMVHQRPDYYASVKVTSARTSNPESGNGQGLKNLYLGDGVNQISVTGNEYLGIQPVWNWYRLPGTTVQQDGRSLKPATDWGVVHGTAAYAGGVSDGACGATAFDYSRYDVKAKKSWFFFDKEQVALGAAINTTSTTYDTLTTLNQCLLTTPVIYATTAGTQSLSTGTVTPANLKWVNQGGIGYFFFAPVSNATIQAVAQSGTWSSLNTAASSATETKNVFTLTLNHGKAVANGTYGYIAVPSIAAGDMDTYLAANPITVLRNDATAQVVRQATLGLAQAAFYAAGGVPIASGQTMAVNTSAAVMLQNAASTLKLTAASPTATAKSLGVALTNVNFSGGTWLDALGTGTATFNLPGGNRAGSSVGLTLAGDGMATPTVSLTSNDGLTASAYAVAAPVTLPANTTVRTDTPTSLAFTSPIGGGASLTHAGPGPLTLSAANTFTGGLSVTGGTVRLTNATAAGPGGATVHAGGTLIVGATTASSITLAGGTLAFAGTPTLASSITVAANTTSTLRIADPLSPSTAINVPFTGVLHGSGDLLLANADNTLSPDAGQALRIGGPNTGTFTGTLTLLNNVKAELNGNTPGVTRPAGFATIRLTAGAAAYGNSLNAVTTTAGYSELSLRNNTTGSQTYGNAVRVVGNGLTVINPLGTAPAGTSVTLGDLRIGDNQTLGVYLSSTFATHPVAFQTVMLDGHAIFAPKPAGFGPATAVGADLHLGNITEVRPGSGLTMNGLRTLYFDGTNTYTGTTVVERGTLVVAPSARGPVLNGAGGGDVRGGRLAFDYLAGESITDAIRAALAAGRLASSSATPSIGLGYLDDHAGRVTVALTLFGDTDLDGGVSIDDFNAMAGHFGESSGQIWASGDFDYDGGVSIGDFNAFAANFGKSTAVLSPSSFATLLAFAAAHDDLIDFEAATGVPEPSVAVAVAVMLIGGCRRRRVS